MRDVQCAGETVPAATCSRRQVLRRFAGWGGVSGLAALLPAAVAAEAEAGAAAEALPAARTLRAGLVHPWGVDFLPDGDLLVSERAGRLRRISPDGQRMATVSGVPGNMYVGGQGGLLDVQVEVVGGDAWVWFTYSERGSGNRFGAAGVALARARVVGNSLRDLHVIFRARPKVSVNLSNLQYGSRVVLAPGGKVFVSLGEHRTDGERIKAQWLNVHHGKIVRVNRDGSVPPDNPFVGHPDALPEIWTLGHRNPQGLALHPFTGELWENEHGPQGGDELNLVQRGHNYGWPLISYGCEYGTPPETCRPVGGRSAAPGMDQPVTKWVPLSIAPSGMSFYDGAMFPEWRGSLFIGALADRSVWRVVLSGHRVVTRQALYRGLTRRIRHVRQAPDGALLLLTDEDNGRILRIAR